MGRITNLLIGLVVIAFVFTGMIYFMSNAGTTTGEASLGSYNSSSYNKMQEINELSREIETKSNTSVEQSTADILGSYFKQGYSAFRLTSRSLQLTTDMVDDAKTDMKIDDGSNTFFVMISVILGIIVIFGVIIYAVLGRDV